MEFHLPHVIFSSLADDHTTTAASVTLHRKYVERQLKIIIIRPGLASEFVMVNSVSSNCIIDLEKGLGWSSYRYTCSSNIVYT